MNLNPGNTGLEESTLAEVLWMLGAWFESLKPQGGAQFDFSFFPQHTCTHVVLPERCWVESAGGMSSSAVVMHKRGFATTKTRCQRKPGKLDGLKLGLGERCPRQ